MTKKLAFLLAMLPLAALADVPRSIPAEWVLDRPFSRVYTLAPAHTLSGYALVGLMCVVLLKKEIVISSPEF